MFHDASAALSHPALRFGRGSGFGSVADAAISGDIRGDGLAAGLDEDEAQAVRIGDPATSATASQVIAAAVVPGRRSRESKVVGCASAPWRLAGRAEGSEGMGRHDVRGQRFESGRASPEGISASRRSIRPISADWPACTSVA